MHKAIRSLTHTQTHTHSYTHSEHSLGLPFRIVRGFAVFVSLMAKCFYLSERTRHFMGMQRVTSLYLPQSHPTSDIRNFYLIVFINCVPRGLISCRKLMISLKYYYCRWTNWEDSETQKILMSFHICQLLLSSRLISLYIYRIPL